jgi:hypothetical protein
MAGPGGAEVGRVHIKVVPDFTHFRKEMLEELRKWDGREVTIKVKADRSALAGITKDLTKAAKQSSKNASKEVSKGLKQASKDATVNPSINSKTLTKRRLQNQLNKLFSDLEVKLNLDKASVEVRDAWDKEFASVQKKLSKLEPSMPTGLFNADARFVSATLKRLRDETGQVWDSPEVRAAQLRYGAEVKEGTRILKEQQRELDKLMKMASDYQISNPLDRAGHKNDLVAMREYIHGFRTLNGEVKRIATATEHNLMNSAKNNKLFAGIVAAGGGLAAATKMMKDFGTAAAGAGKKIGGLAHQLSPQGLGLNVSLAGFLLLGAAITMIAGPIVGLLAASLLSIPGLLATVMAPIGATILGFKGIKKAAENAGLFGDKNGDKKGGGALGEALTELQKKVEDTFEIKLTKPFEDIGKAAPAMIKPLETVASGVADIMTGIINSITGNKDRLAATFTGIGQQLTNSFAPGLQSFSDALIGLAAEFTKPGGALEGVGKWFKDTMADFSRWVEQGIKTGDLTRTFRELGDTLKVVLDAVGGIAEKGIDFIKDPAKMDGFKATLKEIGDGLNNIMIISEKLAPFLDALAKIFNGGAMGAAAEKATGQFAKTFDLVGMSEDKIQKIMEKYEADNSFWSRLNPFGDQKAMVDAARKYVESAETQAALAAKSGADSGRKFAEQYVAAQQDVLTKNQEAFSVQPWALGATDVNDQIVGQLTQQAEAAIDGARQAMAPLQEGLQQDINTALTPLGDIAGRVATAFNDVPGLVQGSLGQIPGIVSTAMGSLGTEAETAMRAVSDAVVTHCALAVNTANTEAPLIKAPFEALKGSMESVGADIMGGLAIGIRNNAGLAKQAASVAAAEVLQAARDAVHSKSPSRDFMDLGKDINAGLGIGINNSVDGPISAIREVMQAIKDVFGTAEGINLNFFMGQASAGMSSLAESSREFRTNMTEVATTPQLSSGLDATQTDLADIKRQKAEIDLRLAELTAQKNATQDKAAKSALQAEMDQLRIQKERLDLMKEESGLQEERKTAIQKLSDTIATNIVDMIKMPGEFAKATANAAMQDVGISGNGALPTIANWALDAGTNFIFNVNNMDDALQGQQAQQRKAAAGITSR